MVNTQSEMVGCLFYALKIPYFWIIVILYDKTLDKGVIMLYLCRKINTMKTFKVRPVLVESKEIQKQMLWLNIETNKLWFDNHGKVSYQFKPQELILISLEDEKIEVDELCFDYETNKIIKAKWINPHNCKKVIARQPKISPEYISKFVEQYNNGCVDDLEIEMNIVTMQQSSEKYEDNDILVNGEIVESVDYTLDDVIDKTIEKYGKQPKLTNGFITIVGKEPIYFFPIEVKKDNIIIYGAGKFHEERLILNRDQAALLFVELYKFLEFDKEITYTEEEVIKYCLEALNMGFDLNNRPSPRLNGKTGTQYFMEWFNENKK